MKKLIKKLFKKLGYSLSKSDPKNALYLDCNLIIDVGAHTGEFARSCLENNFKGDILSFEPQDHQYNILKTNSKKYRNWHVYKKCAIGSKNGEVNFNIFNETTCSSILYPTKNLTSIDKNVGIIGVENCKVYTLNYLFENQLKIKNKTFLKIDTQGYDLEVIMGGDKILKNILFLQLEMCVEPLYEGEKNFIFITEFLNKKNFILWDLGGKIKNQTGRVLSFDAIFKNKNL